MKATSFTDAMANNSTTFPASVLSDLIETISNTKVIDEKTAAMIFIIVVVFWYASSIVVLLGMQIGALNEMDEDWMKNPTESFAQNLRNPIQNKEILEQLVDKQKREKLWDIYLGTLGDTNGKITRAEHLRIRNIEKQLAMLNPDSEDNISSSMTDLSSIDSRLRLRRRLSADYHILEQWQRIADDLKAHEKWPWVIRKLIVRRNFRRRRSATECRSTS